MAEPVIEVAVAVVRKGGQWLVARRYPDVHLGDKWEFPGGKHEPGESMEQTALRELLEECGVAATVDQVLPAFTHDYGDRIVRITPVVCNWLSGDPLPLGCVECCWLPIEQIAKLDMPAVNSSIMAELARI